MQRSRNPNQPTSPIPAKRNKLSLQLDLGSLRIALIHDWLVSMRGGEKVLELLCSRFPNAPLSTLLYIPGSVSSTIANRQIKTSLLQSLPFSRTKYRQYLPLFPLFAELSKVEDCDVVISSSHAVAKGMVRKGSDSRPLHICYIHTPMRYIWDRFDDYFGPDKVGALGIELHIQAGRYHASGL